MKAATTKLCIYPKDIQRITGKSYRQSIRMLQNIRKELNKLQNELVSIGYLRVHKPKNGTGCTFDYWLITLFNLIKFLTLPNIV
jgi:hypothetical protein